MVPKFRAWDKTNNEMISWSSLLYGHSLRNVFMRPEMCGLVLMQSTGLKDKNGVEIFEGDIAVNQYGNVGYVAYLQQEAGFVIVLKKSDYRLGHRNTGESYDVTTNHEVIGNVHSNSELLEQANEN